jgi:hypothetical protein
MSRNLVPTLVLLTLGSTPVFGQATGRLTGSVTDPSGAAVPDAIVDLLLKDGAKPVLSTTTTAEGLFTMTNIRVGTYRIAVTSKAFAPYRADRIVIDASRDTTLPAIKLTLASTNTTVQVTEDIETVQTANAEASTTISTKQIERLPILDRDVISLISTQPGVASNGASETVINGQRSSFSNVTLDGINIQDNYIRTGGLDFQPNLLLMGQVSEFTIVSSNGNATLGGGSSQVNLVTPSGTNQLHGGAYWYNRNNYFAANTWFDNKDGNPRPFLNQNQLGASLGGPIKRDKLFFYFNFEAVRTRQQSEINATILTATARQGIFSYLDTRTGQMHQLNILTAMGLKMDPVMAQNLAKTPGPEKINNFRTGDSQPGLLLNTAGYAFNQQANRDRNNITGRLDYTLSTKHNFSVTYAYNNDHVDRGDAATNYDVVPDVYNDDAAKLLSVGWRWNPIPAMTNELRGGFNLAPTIFASTTAYPSSFIDGMAWSNPVNEFLPQGRFTDTFHINDGATWVHGRHTIQFGFQSERVRVNVYDFGGTIPDYVVSTGAGHPGLTSRQFVNISQADLDNANTLLASLAGLIDNASQLYNVTSKTSGYVASAPFRRHYALSNYSGYVLDTWKAWPKFTITLGLRYEYFTPTTETDSLGLMPILQNNNPITTLLNPCGALNFAGSGSNPFYTPSKTNFAPNIGFAWDIFGNGRTALRGGYSVHYVNDEAIRAVDNNTNTNSGLVGSSSIVGSKAFASNLPALTAPDFHVPITFAENHAADPGSALGLINPNLKTPYVQEYRISLQHKIKGTIIEASYVGNHGVQEIRAFDFNQVQINSKGFLADFMRAQNNGFLAQHANPAAGFVPTYNPNIPGSQPLTVFPLLKNGGSLSGRNADPTVLADIAEGQVGELASYYQINGLNGSVNFFQNFNSLGTNYLTNFSNSSYNAFQINVSHRVDSGLYVQGNYTFSKVLSDSDGNTQERFDPFLNVFNGSIERARAPFDITHVFHLNATYDLPFGKGHRFSAGRVLDRVIGGWSASSVLMYQSGAPFSILSGLGTFNRVTSGRSRYNTATSIVGGDALANMVKFQMTGNGPYEVVSSVIDPQNGNRAVAPFGDPPFQGQVFFNPAAGTVGALQRRLFTGPNAFSMDVSLIKNTKITEHHSLEFRVDSFNVLNHAAFAASDQNVNATTFGQIAFTVNDRRVIQFGLNYQF